MPTQLGRKESEIMTFLHSQRKRRPVGGFGVVGRIGFAGSRDSIISLNSLAARGASLDT